MTPQLESRLVDVEHGAYYLVGLAGLAALFVAERVWRRRRGPLP